MKRLLVLALSLTACQTAAPLNQGVTVPSARSTQVQAEPAPLSATLRTQGRTVTLNVQMGSPFRTQALNCNENSDEGPTTQITQFRATLTGVGIDGTRYPSEAATDGVFSNSGCTQNSTVTFADVPVGVARVITLEGLNAAGDTLPNSQIKAVFHFVDPSTPLTQNVNPRTTPAALLVEQLLGNANFPAQRQAHLVGKLNLSTLQSLLDILTGVTGSVPGDYAFTHPPGLLKLDLLRAYLEDHSTDPNLAMMSLQSDTGAHNTYRDAGGMLIGKVIGLRVGSQVRLRYNDLSSLEAHLGSATNSEMDFTLPGTQSGSHTLEVMQKYLSNPAYTVSQTLTHDAEGVLIDMSPPETPSWAQANGPFGGILTGLATSPQIAGDPLLYAASETGGVYVSSDAGANWGLASTGLNSLQVTAVLAKPLSQEAYAATPGTIYKTTDAGANWTPVHTAPGLRVNRFSFNSDLSQIYAATNDGLRQSLDGGNSWTAVNGMGGLLVGLDMRNVVHYVDAIPANSRFFAASSGKVYSATDGTDWAEVYDVGTDKTIEALTLTSTPAHLVIGVQGLLGSEVSYASPTNPSTWNDYGYPNFATAVPGAQITTLETDASGKVLLGTRNRAAWSTVSSTAPWQHLPSPEPLPPDLGVINQPHITSIVASGTNPLVTTFGGGVSELVGSDWQTRNHGLHATYITALAQHPSNPSFLAAATRGGGVFLSYDAGSSWVPKHDGLYNHLGERKVRSLAFDANGNLYAGTQGAGVRVLQNPASCYETTPASDWQWHAVADAGLPSNPLVQALAAVDGQLIAGLAAEEGHTATGLFRISQPSFSTCSSGPSVGSWGGDLLSAANVYSLQVKPGGSTGAWQIFAGLSGGNLRKSSDSGATWGSAFSTGLTSAVIGLAASPDIPNRLYAVAYTGGGVARSNDGGLTWSSANTGLPPGRVKSVATFRYNANQVLVGLESGGIYRSTTGGLGTWLPFNMGHAAFEMGAFPALLTDNASTTGFVLTGTSGMGVWKHNVVIP
ncbi:MAG: WD40/YVTN/BNR-like repeat-containing protein [Candidatus Sericytochromatia bacterium]